MCRKFFFSGRRGVGGEFEDADVCVALRCVPRLRVRREGGEAKWDKSKWDFLLGPDRK